MNEHLSIMAKYAKIEICYYGDELHDTPLSFYSVTLTLNGASYLETHSRLDAAVYNMFKRFLKFDVLGDEE